MKKLTGILPCVLDIEIGQVTSNSEPRVIRIQWDLENNSDYAEKMLWFRSIRPENLFGLRGVHLFDVTCPISIIQDTW